eukprot:317004-Chlamydomonas_euryale.AAC.4
MHTGVRVIHTQALLQMLRAGCGYRTAVPRVQVVKTKMNCTSHLWKLLAERGELLGGLTPPHMTAAQRQRCSKNAETGHASGTNLTHSGPSKAASPMR